MQVISAQRRDLVEVFTGLRPRQFARLVQTIHREGGCRLHDGRPGRPWALTLENRVLLVAMYCRTSLTMRQLALLFGVSRAAVGRIIDRHRPLLVLTTTRRRPLRQQVLIVDGTVVPAPIRDTAAAKNDGHSTSLRVQIRAETRVVAAVG